MPQLPIDDGVVQKYVLPSTKGMLEPEQAWVELKLGKILAGDMINITNPESTMGVSFEVLVSRIKAWNYTETNGLPTPINLDNVSRMNIEDLTYLLQQLTETGADNIPALSTEQKKSS